MYETVLLWELYRWYYFTNIIGYSFLLTHSCINFICCPERSRQDSWGAKLKNCDRCFKEGRERCCRESRTVLPGERAVNGVIKECRGRCCPGGVVNGVLLKNDSFRNLIDLDNSLFYIVVLLLFFFATIQCWLTAKCFFLMLINKNKIKIMVKYTC